jgi:hypothetical protein
LQPCNAFSVKQVSPLTLYVSLSFFLSISQPIINHHHQQHQQKQQQQQQQLQDYLNLGDVLGGGLLSMYGYDCVNEAPQNCLVDVTWDIEIGNNGRGPENITSVVLHIGVGKVKKNMPDKIVSSSSTSTTTTTTAATTTTRLFELGRRTWWRLVTMDVDLKTSLRVFYTLVSEN